LWDCAKAHGPEITSVARFAVVEDGGASLRLLDAAATGGVYRRHIAFDPSGTVLFAANHNSGTVTAFHVDQDSGALTPRAPRCPRSRRCACCLSGRRRACRAKGRGVLAAG
jgi:6-phosphogluconolactonase (cycloisomerase 2 family)